MIAQLMAIGDSGQPELATPEDARTPRALLIELRSLEQPFQIPVVSISVRDAMRLLSATQRPVESAFKALEAYGWTEDRKDGTGRRRVVLLKSPLRAFPEDIGEADE